MTSYLDSAYTTNPNTRFVQADWNELIHAAARTERAFRERGDAREADQIAIYRNLFVHSAQRHLDRIVSSNGNGHTNGHTKDSTVVTELPGLGLAASEDSTVNGQTPADEKGVLQDSGRGDALPPEPPTVAVPSIEDRIQTLIAQMEHAMTQHPDHQGYEVALKMLHRGRTLAREGKLELAERQFRAASNAADKAEAREYT